MKKADNNFHYMIVLMLLVMIVFPVKLSWQKAFYTAHASENIKNEKNLVGQGKDIQWFKEQMKISDKYIQKESGIWGMTWAHFITMVFLVLFALVALFVLIQQQKRTKEIVEMIKKEMKDDNSG